jgi:DNA-directed RNA polymerase subunit RPC12/RpoP
MNKKPGRPPVPKDKAKSVFIGAFVTPTEAKQINQGIAESGETKSEWMRSALLSEAASGRIILRLRCPECGNEVRKLPRHLKTGGATVCPKCGGAFIDEAVLKEAETLAKLLNL